MFSSIPNLTRKIENKTLEQLIGENIIIIPELLKFGGTDKSQMILRCESDKYYSGNVMGYLGCGNESLVICSRFGEKGNDFFLQYLLEKVMDYPCPIDLKTEANSNQQTLDMLVFLFPHLLKSAIRKGLFKTYIRVPYNNSNPKGTIDIAQHIKLNTPFIGKIAYSQREYSYDNFMTQLIRHTIEFIKQKPYGKNLLFSANNEVKMVVEATEQYRLCDRHKILTKNQKHPIQHAYYYEYRALQALCIIILQNQKQAPYTGANRTYGILFDGAWLWEEYMASLVSNHFYHPMNKAGSGAQQLFYNERRKIGLIYPDFIGKDVRNRLIADAKYKPIDNINRNDYFQVLSYMFRFDAKKGLFLYPEAEENEDLYLWLNQGATFDPNGVSRRDDICLIKHGLKIPKYQDTYQDFVKAMKHAEGKFLQKVKEFVVGDTLSISRR